MACPSSDPSEPRQSVDEESLMLGPWCFLVRFIDTGCVVPDQFRPFLQAGSAGPGCSCNAGREASIGSWHETLRAALTGTGEGAPSFAVQEDSYVCQGAL